MKVSLLFLSIMELIKLHCLSSFVYLLAGESPPLGPLSIVFIVALAADRILARKSRRVVFYFLVHAATFAAAFCIVLLLTQGSPAAAAAFLPLGKKASVSFFILLGTLALYWLRGLWLLRQTSDHEFAALRFDEGITLFLLGFLFTALLKLDNPLPGKLAIPFFAFGILSLGISNMNEGKRGGLSARSKRAMVAATTGIFILGAFGLALLIPSLVEPAKAAAIGLKGASLSLLNMIAAILVWLFSRKGPPRFAEISDSSAAAPSIAEEIGQQGMSAVLMWILVAVLILVATAVLALLIAMLIRILSGKTRQSPTRPKGRPLGALLRAFLRAVREFFRRLERRLGRRRGLSPALEAYRRVLAAGRAGGAPRAATETPREYALRLEARFEAAKNRALPIVAEVEKEAYGPDAARRELGKQAAGPGPQKPLGARIGSPGGQAAALRLAVHFSPARFFAERLKKHLGFLDHKNR